MQVEIKGDELIIRAKINKPLRPSKSGKNLLVCSTNGNMITGATVDGKPVTLGLNAFVAP